MITYKVKVQISCPDVNLKASVFLEVPAESMHCLFSPLPCLPLNFSDFRQFCSPRTASRYHCFFTGEGEYAFFTVLSCTLIARA